MSALADLIVDGRGVATLTLRRPALHNAFDDLLIAHLRRLLDSAAADPAVRVLVLAGEGPSFSAGADLGWMRRMASASHADNLADAVALESLMAQLNGFPCPVVGRIHGAAMGGGVGLVACCDIALAADGASFALSEVRLGLAPAVIGPYVSAKIGPSQARRYFISGERFSAAQALAIGLVHEVVPAGQLDEQVVALVSTLLANGPQAMRAAKRLAHRLNPVVVSEEVTGYTTGMIAGLRASDEGRAGVEAFLGKRSPPWRDVAEK